MKIEFIIAKINFKCFLIGAFNFFNPLLSLEEVVSKSGDIFLQVIMLVIFLGSLHSTTQVTEINKLRNTNMDQNVKSLAPVMTIRLIEVQFRSTFLRLRDLANHDGDTKEKVTKQKGLICRTMFLHRRLNLGTFQLIISKTAT